MSKPSMGGKVTSGFTGHGGEWKTPYIPACLSVPVLPLRRDDVRTDGMTVTVVVFTPTS